MPTQQFTCEGAGHVTAQAVLCRGTGAAWPYAAPIPCCTYPSAAENTSAATNEVTHRSSLPALAIAPPARCLHLKAKQHVPA